MKNVGILVLAVGACLGSAGLLNAQNTTISWTRAREIALARVPNNQGVISEKRKTQGGILVYELDIETPGAGHREIRVDAHTGAIVADQHEDDLLGGTAEKVENAADKAAKAADKAADKIFRKDEVATAGVHISASQAQQIALRQVVNGTIKDVDLERENGILVWEVEVDTPGKGHEEIMIDAHTGAVLQQKYKK